MASHVQHRSEQQETEMQIDIGIDAGSRKMEEP
jgi:hypothetical protein